MNNLAREKLVFELEHLLRHEPAMGTLFVMVLQTNYLLVVTLKNGVSESWLPARRLVRPAGRTSVFNLLQKARLFSAEGVSKTRVSRASIGSRADEAAGIIAECFFKRIWRVWPIRLEHPRNGLAVHQIIGPASTYRNA